jgi:uncharacterized RDD family membrane protein YckC
MQCKYCGFGNGEDDHRCLRCGRRVAGRAVAAPTGYSGALALAPLFDADATLDAHAPFDSKLQSDPAAATQEFFPPLQSAAEAQKAAARPAGRLIPFDQLQKQRGPVASAPTHAVQVEAEAPASRPKQRSMAELRASEEFRPQKPVRREAPPRPQQANFDFVAAPATQPTLKTGVPGQVSCPQAVARPIHRCLAVAVDTAVIMLAFGTFLGIASRCGASFGQGKLMPAVLFASLALFATFYGLVCLITGRETLGMEFLQLEVITFEGEPIDDRTRFIRFATTLLSIGAAGLGMIWALADEENLTWHDHISKTFPTPRSRDRSYLRTA